MQQNLKDSIVKRLLALNEQGEFDYCIEDLSQRKINNNAEAAILIFLLACCHPRLLNDPELQALCHSCFLHTTSNQLLSLLSKPENVRAKQLFDRFVEYAVKPEKLQSAKRSRGR